MLFSIDISDQQCEESYTCQKFQGVASGIRKCELFQIFICERDCIILSHINGLCLSEQVCICGSFVCGLFHCCSVNPVGWRIFILFFCDLILCPIRDLVEFCFFSVFKRNRLLSVSILIRFYFTYCRYKTLTRLQVTEFDSKIERFFAIVFTAICLNRLLFQCQFLQVLDLSGIPLKSADRGEDFPIVIGGGACAYNPEPLAPFFDMFYIGEGETVYDALFDAHKANKKVGGSRRDFLLAAAKIPGIYVPSLYEVTYKEDGTIASFAPTADGVPEKVQKQLIIDMEKEYRAVEAPVVPHIKATQDRVTLEIQRGCIRGCRFCQAGMIYRPTRERDVETLKESARIMLKNTGHEEISLSSLSSSDYSQLKELVNFLIEEFHGKAVNISLPSLRIDAFALDVMSKVQDVKKSSLTFAPEAGSQRLRDVINKGLTEEVILHGAGEAFKGGWNQVKLYFMLGLPTETEDDMKGIAHLAQKIAETYYEVVPKEQRKGKVQINVSTSFFVPKPFTPFQWAPMYTEQDFVEKAKVVKNEVRAQLNQRSIRYNWHEPDVTALEGFLARGDRRCADVILKAYEKGALYDAWTENFDYDIWKEAMAECGVDMTFYTLRERSLDEILPWDFIDTGVSRRFLEREWQRAKEGVVTENCRQKCSACGAMKFKGGVCLEGKN